MGPSCCVCGEIYVPEPEGEETGGGGGGNAHDASLRRGAGAGGGGGSGEESFVVLPDSTPVLSEDYFTLARNQTHHRSSCSSSSSSAIGGLGVSASSSSGLTFNTLGGGSTNPRAGTDTTAIGGLRLAGASGLGGGGGGSPSLAPGSELLESRYSGYGGSGGFGGGWTGSGFGVGSSMLDSIVQISHAGLSDNVRRESLLYELSKRPARCPPLSGGGSSAAVGAGGDEPGGRGGGGGQEEGVEEEHDPTLCCHCYASLLEQIDEDSRLADREALSYRDFVALLDSISAEGGLESSDNTGRTSAPRTATAASNGKTSKDGGIQAADSPTGCSEREESADDATADDAPQDDKPIRRCSDTCEGRDETGDARKANMRYSSDGNPPPSASCSRRAQQQQQDEGKGGGTAESSPSSFSQALRIAQRTSVQLRAELRSLETQREGLCARGSAAWAALSELAYARGVLGEECRELLKESREVNVYVVFLTVRVSFLLSTCRPPTPRPFLGVLTAALHRTKQGCQR